MTILVAGNAALLDLIGVTDRNPGSSEVANLLAGPGASATWLKGGAAPVAALRLARSGHAVRLWHARPADERAVAMFAELSDAGVDTSLCPLVSDSLPCCIIMSSQHERLAWSSRSEAPSPGNADALLRGVSEVIFAPVWDDWADDLLQAAIARGIPCNLFGETPPDRPEVHWHMVVLDAAQMAASPRFSATITCVTSGAAGAVVFVDGKETPIPAETIAVIDSTGAGDAFASMFMGAIIDGTALIEAGALAAASAAQACAHWGAWPNEPPRPRVEAALMQSDRILGALGGMACGDAFGMPNSFLQAPVWRTTMDAGPASSPYHAGYPAGRITDDTEQALALTQALEDGFTHEAIARRLYEWFLSVGGSTSLAVGPSTKRALEAYAGGASVDIMGRTGVTNGAAMRIAPVGVFAGLRTLDIEQTANMVETACWPTHATSPAISGAMAAAWPIAVAIKGGSWNEVLDAAAEGASAGAKRGHWVYSADIGARINAARIMAKTAISSRRLAEDISKLIGAGEPCAETLPAAIGIADFAGGDPALAIEIAGNLRGDTDTIAAIAGAICGAYAGIESLPREWRSLVESVNSISFTDWASRIHDVALQNAS